MEEDIDFRRKKKKTVHYIYLSNQISLNILNAELETLIGGLQS
jgi:hypothetical protein